MSVCKCLSFFFLVCVRVDAVGEQGGAKDPDVVVFAVPKHMAMGA